MANYKDELVKANNLLAEKGYIFLGQNMKFGGTSQFHMVKHLPESQRWELPVTEEMQMGMSLGMSMNDINICSVYHRFDFLILGINQLVNHIDKIRIMSDGQFKAKGLIIKTCIGSTKPMMPGPQHSQDYTEAFKLMFKDIKVVKLESPEQIVPAYTEAMESDTPTLIVEIPDLYNVNLIYDIEKSKDIK